MYVYVQMSMWRETHACMGHYVEELLWRPSIPMDCHGHVVAFVGFLECSPSIIGPGITRVR